MDACCAAGPLTACQLTKRLFGGEQALTGSGLVDIGAVDRRSGMRDCGAMKSLLTAAPNVRAADANVSPPRTNRTASCLNSSV